MKTCNASGLGALLLGVALAPLHGWAQGYGNAGMPERDCSPEAIEYQRELEAAYSRGPLDRAASRLPSGLSVAEAEALRQREEELQRREIEQYDGLLASMPETYRRRAEILFRKAEATRQLAQVVNLAERAVFDECMSNWFICVSDEICYEPVPDYAPAIAIYREIARQHSDYERLDEVFFRLGESLIENNQGSEGVQTLHRLVSSYPQSRYVAEAHLLMGDHFFDNDLLLAARQNYDEVMRFPNSDVYPIAIYKLAWVDYNEMQFTDMLGRLQRVVQLIDEGRVQRADLRRVALRDMLLAYVELDDGWRAAREYYERLEGEDMMRTMLGRLADMLDEQGKDEQRVAVLDFFLQRYPLDAAAQRWSAQTLDSLDKIGDWPRREARARAFIEALEPGGRWWNAQASNPALQQTAFRFSEQTLLGIINRNFSEGERLTTMPAVQHELFVRTASDYEQFFRRFPESDVLYDERFNYAVLLYTRLANSGTYHARLQVSEEEFLAYLRQAGHAFRAVVEMDPSPDAEHAEEAAVSALQIYDDFMKREVPDINQPIPPPHLFVFGERTELGPASQDFVEIVEWFSNIFPEHELIPAASWLAAALYLRANQVGEAAARFETIIEHHPEHRFAQEAALAAFVCYNHVQNWERIESVARRLLTVCQRVRGSEICDRGRLEGAIAYSISNQASDMMAAGDRLALEGQTRESERLFLQAAEKRLALFEEFPTSEWSPDALFDAAATFERARRLEVSLRSYHNYLESYPEHGRIGDARYALGRIYDSQARFREAADFLESLANHPEHEMLGDALVRAARLRQALSEFDRARELFDRVITMEAGSDDAKALHFEVAQMEERRGDLEASYLRLERFRREFPTDALRGYLALGRMAQIRREQGRMADAMRLYGQLLDAFGRGQAAVENGRMVGWVVEPGGNFANEGERRQALAFAAEARFFEAQAAFERANVADLTYRAGRVQELADKLVRRGELVEAAQLEMMEVIAYRAATWAVAASLRVGQLYHNFYKDVMRVPAPDFDACLDRFNDYDACERQDELYNEVLYRFADPLVGRATEALLAGRDTAMAEQVFSSWTTELLAELNDINRSFRTGGGEGVVADQTADRFITTGYILDLSAKERAFREFQERYEQYLYEQELQRLQEEGVEQEGQGPAASSAGGGR